MSRASGGADRGRPIASIVIGAIVGGVIGRVIAHNLIGAAVGSAAGGIVVRLFGRVLWPVVWPVVEGAAASTAAGTTGLLFGTRLGALTKRELMAYFYAPVPYLVMFVFLVITWCVVQFSLTGRVARTDFQPVFQFLTFILLFLLPLLTMNTVAEERARNTLETLLTAPVADWQVVLSKWMGTVVYYVAMLVPTLVYWGVFEMLSGDKVFDTGPMWSSYVGALLLGSMYIAIGVCWSSVTENGLLSAFLTFVTMILMMVARAIPGLSDALPEWGRTALEFLSQQEHFETFLAGKIAVYDIVYFALMTALFLFVAVRAIESRKWR